jgi:hypothetical protein
VVRQMAKKRHTLLPGCYDLDIRVLARQFN